MDFNNESTYNQIASKKFAFDCNFIDDTFEDETKEGTWQYVFVSFVIQKL